MTASTAPQLPLLHLEAVAKQFTLHHQNSLVLRVLENVHLSIHRGECVVLEGPSGTGKSTLLKLIYANYRASAGRIRLFPGTPQELELTGATPRALLAARRDTIGYVSQFLRVIPRVCALDIVAESLIGHEEPGDRAARGRFLTSDTDALQDARAEAARWLQRLSIGRPLWSLPPATFSGGEQQRINVARNLIKPRPLLLLDEPTASLDAANTAVVLEMINEARARGAAILGVFHDQTIAEKVATRRFRIEPFGPAA
ncbi:MAG: phosphonate C-P lyase system protein PhnL [Steroidobacteraceae bacterium]